MMHVLMQVVVLVSLRAFPGTAVQPSQVLSLYPAGHLTHGPLPLQVSFSVPVMVVPATARSSFFLV